jgi:hypothetical protein
MTTVTPTSNVAGRRLVIDGQFKYRLPQRTSTDDDDGAVMTVSEPDDEGEGRSEDDPGEARTDGRRNMSSDEQFHLTAS